MARPPHFTNRDDELLTFFSFVERTSPALMNFYGGQGVGKSWLIHSIREECSLRQIPAVLVDVADLPECTYLGLVGQLRRSNRIARFAAVGAALDNGLSRLQTVSVRDIRPSRESTTVDFGHHNTLTGTWTDVAIGGDVIKPTLLMPEPLQQELLQQLEMEVTEAFAEAFREECEGDRFVLLLDSYDRSNPRLQNWLQHALLPRLAEVTPCSLRIGICGHSPLRDVGSWYKLVVNQHVLPFDYDSSIEYIRKRRPLEPHEADLLYKATRGHPQNLALAMDNLEAESG